MVPCHQPDSYFLSMDLGETKNTLFSMKTDKLKEGQKVQLSIEDANGEEGWSGDVRTLYTWHHLAWVWDTNRWLPRSLSKSV